MKKLLILIFSILISFNSFASIGDTYLCEDKEEDVEGIGKGQFILEWNENSMTKKVIPNPNFVDTSHTAPFVINTNNYFVATIPYREGLLINNFEGVTYTSIFLRNSYTNVNEYICTKF